MLLLYYIILYSVYLLVECACNTPFSVVSACDVYMLYFDAMSG